MKRLPIRIVGLALVAISLWAVPTSTNAWISAAGSCFAACSIRAARRPDVNDGTFRYVAFNVSPLEWYVTACGSGPGSTCDGANWENGDPKTGLLKVTGWPCRAWVWIGYPDPVVPGVYYGNPVAILTSRGP